MYSYAKINIIQWGIYQKIMRYSILPNTSHGQITIQRAFGKGERASGRAYYWGEEFIIDLYEFCICFETRLY